MSDHRITAAGTFDEKCRELDGLLAQLDHDALRRGLPAPDGPSQSAGDGAQAPARRTVRLLAGVVLRETEARLRGLAELAGLLSEEERWSLRTLRRLPAPERRTIAGLLRLPTNEREQLAIALGLS